MQERYLFMSKTLSLHHIVFSTRFRQPTLEPAHAEELHRFIWNMLKDRDCHLCRINSMPDHLHFLVDVSPTNALATLVKDLKANSSLWMKRSGRFPIFIGWSKGYYAASISANHKEAVIDYIRSQQSHHSNIPFDQEIQALYRRAGLQYNPDDLQ